MITLILPGHSAKNKSWVEDVAKNLKLGGQIRPVFWDHWGDESQKFNAKEKAELLIKHSKGDRMNIIAKSIGTLVASYIINKVPEQIGKIIFCGIPLGVLDEDKTKMMSEIGNKKLIVFQNDLDPYGTIKDVKALFPNFKIIEKHAINHNYPYYSDFQKFLES